MSATVLVRSFDDLLKAALEGNWDLVDNSIDSSHLTPYRLAWALGAGLSSKEENSREFAAMLLFKTRRDISDGIARMRAQMSQDIHPIVQYWLAMALWKRGERGFDIWIKLQSAKLHPEVGDLAGSLLKTK